MRWLIAALVLVGCARSAPPDHASGEPLAQLDDYAVDTSFAGPIPPLNFERDADAKRFVTAIRSGIAEGPNFAGHFALVTWGCGTDCQSYVIVDLSDGTALDDSALDFSCHDVSYKRTSRLVVMTPADTASGRVCSSHDTIRLAWTGAKFDTVR